MNQFNPVEPLNLGYMNILLDAIPLGGLMTGISRYLRSLYLQLERLPGVSVYYFNGRSLTKQMPDQTRPDFWIKTTSFVDKFPDPLIFGFRAAAWLSYEYKIRRRIWNGSFSVYHETAFTPSAIKNVPQVFTIYDLSLTKFRELHPKERVWFSDIFLKNRLGYAKHIITISDFVRSEICDELHLPPEKVTAIPLAPDPFFFPRKRGKAEVVVKALGLPRDYILFVGTLEPRKNLPILIKAAAVCESDIPIVLVGWEGWGSEEWLEKVKDQGLQNRIFTTGYVDEESLACLYSNALALVFPSLYEGFGLPVLEAMSCGCPVICSDAASLPEVAGNAALLIDPAEFEDLAVGIDKILSDSALRTDLIQKGFERAAQFSWERIARQTLEVFRSVVDQG